MKKVRCHGMLRDDIREFVRLLGCKTLNDMIARAQAPREEDVKAESDHSGPGEEAQDSRFASERPSGSGLLCKK